VARRPGRRSWSWNLRKGSLSTPGSWDFSHSDHFSTVVITFFGKFSAMSRTRRYGRERALKSLSTPGKIWKTWGLLRESCSGEPFLWRRTKLGESAYTDVHTLSYCQLWLFARQAHGSRMTMLRHACPPTRIRHTVSRSASPTYVGVQSARVWIFWGTRKRVKDDSRLKSRLEVQYALMAIGGFRISAWLHVKGFDDFDIIPRWSANFIFIRTEASL